MNYKTLISVFIGVLMFSINVSAQKKFSELSAKQKIRLGKKEQKAAKNDPEYLRLMDEGLTFFQQKEYQKAMDKYEEAHQRRPNNVYPMVMLEDVESAKEKLTLKTKMESDVVLENDEPIAKKPEFKAPEPQVNQEINKTKKPEKTEIIETQTEQPIVINTPEKLEKQVPKPPPPPKVEEKVYKDDGIYRETLKEGSATIHQITIVEKGNTTVIRQVVHTWGGIFYFKDKDAITKQEYEKLISKLDD